MDNVEKVFKDDDITILRLYTPEHKNLFFLQVICYLFFAIQVIYFAKKYSKSYDIIFSTSSRLGTGFLGYFLSKLLNKKFALDMRDVFSDNLKSINMFKT